ncbi:hypothetical protein FXO38_28453 [Capsicum annuum]|nr:hypothetical protein FXO38_28453 [Capsicum annuum]
MKELVSSLPQGPRKSSTARHSCIALSNYKIYQEEKKKQEATVARLERAYSLLAKSHRDLKESYDNMKNTEKKRDKFFTKIWKRVKGLWKVLKPYDRFTSAQVEMMMRPMMIVWMLRLVELMKSLQEIALLETDLGSILFPLLYCLCSKDTSISLVGGCYSWAR